MAKKLITNRLRILRAEQGLSQLDVAQETDIGPNRYWKIENDYASPTSQERKVLRRLFWVTDADMFPGFTRRQPRGRRRNEAKARRGTSSSGALQLVSTEEE